MKWLFGIEVVVIMTVLRLVVPLLVMFLLVHALHRLEARWQAADQALATPLNPAAGD